MKAAVTDRPELANLPIDEALRSLVDSLIASFDEVTGKWRPCWSTQGLLPCNAVTGKPYRGINTVMLWSAQVQRQYVSTRWATYKQWQSIGAQVPRGAKGVRGIRWVEVDAGDGEGGTKLIPRVFPLFNTAQVTGAPTDESEGIGASPDWFPHWQTFRNAIPVKVIEGPPCYIPALDVVQCPKMCMFDSVELYCRTEAHEFAHWTKHETRLERDMPARFDGMDAYAFEELVAEISAALTCGWLQVPETNEVRDDHVRYIKHWVDALQAEPRILLSAAQLAQHATDHLLAYSTPVT